MISTIMSKLAFFLFFPFFRRKKQDKIIYTVEVEFQYKWKRDGYTLRNKQDYRGLYLQEHRNIENVVFNSKEVEETILKTIEYELPDEIYDILGYKTEIKINKVSYGSITVIFTVILATYYGISRYKNFVESCELIRKHISRLLIKKLDDRFGENIFGVSVDTEQHRLGNKQLIDIENSYGIAGRPTRDGFFYFLLLGFLFLATVLGILVYHSFMQTYFK